MRLASQPDHDTGYDIADEHRDVVYRLWEGSWEDEAVQQDNRVFADPSKIHRVRHFVRHYQVDAIHLAEQRSGHRCCAWRDRPHAAGNSPPRMRTACSLTGRTKTIQGWLSAISDGARRRMDGTLPTSSFFLVEPLWWDALANKQERNTKSIICRRASKALWRSSPVPAGIDLSRYEADEPIRCEKTTFNKVEAITTLSHEPWTLRRIIGQMGLGSRNAPIVGSADEVANELTSWSRMPAWAVQRETHRHAGNIRLEDFVDLVVPILQERGVYKHQYASGPSGRNCLVTLGCRTPTLLPHTGALRLKRDSRQRNRKPHTSCCIGWWHPEAMMLFEGLPRNDCCVEEDVPYLEAPRQFPPAPSCGSARSARASAAPRPRRCHVRE
jgi:long-chain alkane monooxygenase